jgi:hypothetical protein
MGEVNRFRSPYRLRLSKIFAFMESRLLSYLLQFSYNPLTIETYNPKCDRNGRNFRACPSRHWWALPQQR